MSLLFPSVGVEELVTHVIGTFLVGLEIPLKDIGEEKQFYHYKEYKQLHEDYHP